jgi:hypothetical protein
MRLADHVILNFNNNMSAVAVFLDIEKAFDTTWYSGLLYNLTELEFSTSLIKLIISFLTNRKFRVFVGGEFFYAKRNSGSASSRFRPCPNIVRSRYKRCARRTWNSSCSICGRYMYLRDRKKHERLCSLQIATRPHCSKVVVRAMEHKD